MLNQEMPSAAHGISDRGLGHLKELETLITNMQTELAKWKVLVGKG